MIRFISHLFHLNYEECKSCQILKEQLEFEREEKHELINTLLRIVKPDAVVADRINTPTDGQIISGAKTFSRRRAALELKDRIEAQTRANSNIIAKPDSEISEAKTIEQLEQELNLSGREQNG